MSFNICRELAKKIKAPSPVATPTYESFHITGNKQYAQPVDKRPILQLNAFPMTLSPEVYKNPHSSINPNGSYNSLYAFSELTNTVPFFTEYYNASLNTISALYGNLLDGVTIDEQNQYTQSVIAQAQRNFESAHFANMDGIPGYWYPVYATPEDWFDTSNVQRFSEITLDLTNTNSADGPYQTLSNDNEDMLTYLANNKAVNNTVIDRKTKLKSIKFKYLEVRLNRPWFNFSIFSLNGWYISGQNSGFFSSGNTINNQGILPLITTSLLVAININVDADWSPRDQHNLQKARLRGETTSIGPFITAADSSNSTELHVIGWISQLVPLAPQNTYS